MRDAGTGPLDSHWPTPRTVHELSLVILEEQVGFGRVAEHLDSQVCVLVLVREEGKLVVESCEGSGQTSYDLLVLLVTRDVHSQVVLQGHRRFLQLAKNGGEVRQHLLLAFEFSLLLRFVSLCRLQSLCKLFAFAKGPVEVVNHQLTLVRLDLLARNVQKQACVLRFAASFRGLGKYLIDLRCAVLLTKMDFLLVMILFVEERLQREVHIVSGFALHVGFLTAVNNFLSNFSDCTFDLRHLVEELLYLIGGQVFLAVQLSESSAIPAQPLSSLAGVLDLLTNGVCRVCHL